ncbi:hypothetical protein ACJIZ3_016246 [Penstemon smallii]|uniref:Uncharacterized protein n=1 Tax=Penstemon smallii TaxID=265156 RepID=A0ABD3RQ22_9LAMI
MIILQLIGYTRPLEGRAAVDWDCGADEAEAADDFKDREKELVLPEDDAGVERVPKPVNPEDGADVPVVVAADVPVVVAADAAEPTPIDAGKANPVKLVLALLPAEEAVENALVAAGAEAVVVVVVVMVENREEGVVSNATGLETDDVEAADDWSPVFPNENPDDADEEETELVVLLLNEKPEVVVLVELEEAADNENDGVGDVETVGNENPGAEEAEVVEAAPGNANPGAADAEEVDPNVGAAAEELVDVPNGGAAEDDPNNEEEDPNRPGVGLGVEDGGVEDPNRPVVEAEPDPKDGAVVVTVVAGGDNPNKPGDDAILDPNNAALVAAVDAGGVDDPNRLAAGVEPWPNKGVVVPLLVGAAEEDPNRLGVGAPDPNKFADPGAGDPNNVEVPNGDGEGDGEEGAAAEELAPKRLGEWHLKRIRKEAPKPKEGAEGADDAVEAPKPKEGAEGVVGAPKPKEGEEEVDDVVEAPKPKEGAEEVALGLENPNEGDELLENEKPVPAMVAVAVAAAEFRRDNCGGNWGFGF